MATNGSQAVFTVSCLSCLLSCQTLFPCPVSSPLLSCQTSSIVLSDLSLYPVSPPILSCLTSHSVRSHLSFCLTSHPVMSHLSFCLTSHPVMSHLSSCLTSHPVMSHLSFCHVWPLFLSCLIMSCLSAVSTLSFPPVLSVRSLYTILPSCPVCPQSLQFSPQRELLSWIRTVGLRGGNLPPNHSFFLLPPLLAELVYYVQHKQYTLENTLRNIKSARNLWQDVMMLLFLFCCPRQRWLKFWSRFGLRRVKTNEPWKRSQELDCAGFWAVQPAMSWIECR